MAFQQELIAALRAHSDRTAIEQGPRHTDYDTLLRRANRISSALLARGLEQQTVVGIQLDDRVDLICAVIGVVNARCAFVLLDSTLPPLRREAMLNSLNLSYLITAGAPGDANTGGLTTLRYEDLLQAEADELALSRLAYDEDDSLYIYFTSGTTGTPKGIVGRNGSLLQFLQWEIREFGIDASFRVSQFVSPYFDAFLRDVFVPLLAGGTICIPPDGKDILVPDLLASWIEAERITLIHCVPSFFRIFNSRLVRRGQFADLRYILLSGERILPSELVNWYAQIGDRVQLVNLYGPTEATMVRSFYRIRPEDAQSAKIPVGRAIEGSELLVLDESLSPCATLVPGELYIVSPYLTKGYLDNPALNREKFVYLSSADGVRRRAFRTGDRARLLPDGNIDLLGREDRQVKVRGIRIELDEIERLLTLSALVQQSVVIRHEEEGSDASLLAFVLPSPEGASMADLAVLLEKHLSLHLPSYMIPARTVLVDTFPLLPNGKINYRELQVPASPVAAPVNETETRLVRIWKEVLGADTVSTVESFHSLGGNSISIMRLIGRIYKEFNVRFSLSQLFDHLTVQKQAAFISKAKRDQLFVIPKAAPKAAYSLSMAQQRMYFQYQYDRTTTAFNMPMAWEIRGGVEKERIEAAIKALIARHEILRTHFTEDPAQVVEAEVDFHLEEITCPPQGLKEAVEVFIRPFDLERAPLLRCALITAGERTVLAWDVHHIVCDGLSETLLVRDFLSFFQGDALKPLRTTYKDYAEWEAAFRQTDEYAAERAFWLGRFEGELPLLHLPVHEEYAGSDAGGHLHFTVPAALIDPLVAEGRKDEVTAFSTLFSLFFLCLGQFTGDDELVIGTNATGRMQEELEDLVGMFAKTLPIRYRINTDQSFLDTARELHGQFVQAGSRQLFDFVDLVTELNRERDTPVGNLFDAMFVLQNFERQLSAPALDFARYEFDTAAAKYPITLFANGEDDESYYFKLEYGYRCLSREEAEALVNRFRTLVRAVSAQPEQPLAAYLDGARRKPVADDILFNF